MIICTVVTFICSAVSSSIANRISAERAHRITGVVLLILGAIMIVAEWENVVSTFYIVMKMLGASRLMIRQLYLSGLKMQIVIFARQHCAALTATARTARLAGYFPCW